MNNHDEPHDEPNTHRVGKKNKDELPNDNIMIVQVIMHNVFSDKMFLNRKDYLLNVNESSGKITKHEYYLKV